MNPVGRRAALLSAAWASGLALAAPQPVRGPTQAGGADVPRRRIALRTVIAHRSGDAHVTVDELKPGGAVRLAETRVPAANFASLSELQRMAQTFARERLGAEAAAGALSWTEFA